MRRVLLTIGGLDPSGGAGILADLRAARAVGVETVSVLSALTAQSSARLLDRDRPGCHPVLTPLRAPVDVSPPFDSSLGK